MPTFEETIANHNVVEGKKQMKRIALTALASTTAMVVAIIVIDKKFAD